MTRFFTEEDMRAALLALAGQDAHADVRGYARTMADRVDGMESSLSPGLVLTVRFGNEAMPDVEAAGYAIETCVRPMIDGETEGIIRDLNGNTVGGWQVQA